MKHQEKKANRPKTKKAQLTKQMNPEAINPDIPNAGDLIGDGYRLSVLGYTIEDTLQTVLGNAEQSPSDLVKIRAVTNGWQRGQFALLVDSAVFRFTDAPGQLDYTGTLSQLVGTHTDAPNNLWRLVAIPYTSLRAQLERYTGYQQKTIVEFQMQIEKHLDKIKS